MKTGTLLAGLACFAAGGSAFAGSATSVIGSFASATDGAPTVFEDDTFNLNSNFSDGVQVGDEVFAAFRFQEVGVGVPSPTLDGGNAIVGGPSVATSTADITVEGVVNARVGAVLLGAGLGGSDVIVLESVLAEVYTQDFFELSPVSDRVGTEAAFSDGTFAASFALDGLDDFYILTGNASTGVITNFALGLSVVTNATFPDIDPGLVSSIFSPVPGGSTVDIFGEGTIGPVVVGDDSEFNVGDGNFAINLVPSPAAAGAGLLGVLGLVARRRRSA